MTVRDERDWMADTLLLRRHHPAIDPSSLTPFQFISMLTTIDRNLFGPLVHILKVPKS